MSIYQEISCSKIKIINRDNDGKKNPERKFKVKMFGENGVVFEEEWHELPKMPTKKLPKHLI